MTKRIVSVFFAAVVSVMASCGGDSKNPSNCPAACTSSCTAECGEQGVASVTCPNDACNCECGGGT